MALTARIMQRISEAVHAAVLAFTADLGGMLLILRSGGLQVAGHTRLPLVVAGCVVATGYPQSLDQKHAV